MRKLSFFVAIALTSVSLTLSGCVVLVPITIFLQNPTNQPIHARLYYHELGSREEADRLTYQAVFAKGLRYSLKTIKPSRRAVRQLTDTLLVSATDTAATFTIPAHATVLLVSAYGTSYFRLPTDAKLYLQSTAGATRVLTAANFQQAARFRRRAFSYTISLPTP